MLSGMPCTGKSTWRKQIIEELKKQSIPVNVVSADDIAFQLRDQYNDNLRKTADTLLTYMDICNQANHRKELEKEYEKKLIAANELSGIVILDRTHLTPMLRNKELKLIKSQVHCVSFIINDHNSWQMRLHKRNKDDPEKLVLNNIIEKLAIDSYPPECKEGFESIILCRAIGEQGWEKIFSKTIAEVILVYQNFCHPDRRTTFIPNNSLRKLVCAL